MLKAIKLSFFSFSFLFVAYRTSIFSASGSFSNLTYDALRGNNGMVDIATGIFNVQVSGDYELHYQGRDVSVFPFFQVIMIHSFIINSKHDKDVTQ